HQVTSGPSDRMTPQRRVAVTRLLFPVVSVIGLMTTLASEASSVEDIIKSVTFRSWSTPSKSAYPHYVALAPDGSVWYTASKANRVGRLDPRSGAIHEYPLTTTDCEPLGIAIDKRGDVWYAGSSAGLIGRLVPRTRKLTEYKMPDPNAVDPHALVFDARGILWFTVEVGNFVGMLDPKKGHITLVPLPMAESRPRDIKVDSKGTPFFTEFNTNKIGSIDPATMRITEYLLPASDARPISLAIAEDGFIYYTDYFTGLLGRFEPRSGRFDEWLSPSGRQSKPYAIAADAHGAVWYAELGKAPQNVLVRFDPKALTMTTWTVPDSSGTISHMVARRNDELWFADSDVGNIVRARVVRSVRDQR
ncbi:MAG: virginiamycin B lyase family protein, partial [Vicinamibacterales bacterium]